MLMFPRLRFYAKRRRAGGNLIMSGRATSRWFLRGCPCCFDPSATRFAVSPDRRSFIAGGLASAGAAAMAVAPATARTPAAARIDVHHHVAPPKWLADVIGRDLLQPATRDWSVSRSIEDMDKGSVAAAIVSVTNPGLWFGDPEQTRRLARDSNDMMATLVHDRPTRFGMFAAMPLPNADATLREIEYALDVLKADGIGLFTSYHDMWLGNPAFVPVMEELDRRGALVFVHPTAAACCMNLVPDVHPGVMEYGTDTTRAILGILFSGAAVRFPRIRFIWSHAGGTAPFLAGRIEGSVRRLKDHAQRLPNGAISEMRKFHYDVAGAANPGALVSLTRLVAMSQILFGTDYPSGNSRDIIAGLADVGFSDHDLGAIGRENALRLLPRFAAQDAAGVSEN
jgi:6-methylsalicylate decarboxylase